jgi:hypothetical protein
MADFTDDWLHEYTLLVLRLNRLIGFRTDDDSLLDYYGLPEYQTQVNQEPQPVAKELVRHAQQLAQTITAQGFEHERADYLAKLVRALETVARRADGETIRLREQALGCFDLQVDYTPEKQFDQAYALYDDGLPGTGDVAKRLQTWREHHTLPSAKRHLLPDLIDRAVLEAKQRTQKLVPLPEDAELIVEDLPDQPFRALAMYLGNHRSKILVNQRIPFNLAELLYLVCHETYPGHIAELILKEQHLIEQKAYREQQVSFLLTPPFVISEGIALWAHRQAFAHEEASDWLTRHIYAKVGITPDGSQLSPILQATDLLWGVRCNAALMLDEGRSEPEVVKYLMQYALLDEATASRTLQSLQRPFCEAYIFTYHYGRQLLEPWLSGVEKNPTGNNIALKRLLTQQILPSNLSEQLSEPLAE